MRIALAQLNQVVGDFDGNVRRIADAARRAAVEGAALVLTPELSIAGYPPEDLLLRASFYASCERAIAELAQRTADLPLRLVVGAPVRHDGRRYNAAIVLFKGAVVGEYRKWELPNYDVFDEERYFEPGDAPLIIDVEGAKCGILICEDFWFAAAPRACAAAGAQVVLALNASPYHIGKQHVRVDVGRANVCIHGIPMLTANLVGGQDELVFDGGSFVLDASGEIVAQAAAFEEDFLLVDLEVADGRLVPARGPIAESLSEDAQVYGALVLGVRDYLAKNGFPGAVIGLSGGVDSALTLAIAVDALGAERVRAVMMPSPYTAEISWVDARDMASRLGVRYDELPIGACFSAFRETLAAEFAGLAEDATEENIQARIRGTLLMALSNKHGAIVLTTGNKSEMAVGYCTLYGDMAGGFAVIKDIAKTLVWRLARWRNTVGDVIPERIITRAPSAELRPDQTDQDSLPPYDILDAIMQRYMEHNLSAAEIAAEGFARDLVDRVVRLIRVNEYKRRQAPVGIRVTHRAFGRDWRYPITSRFRD